MTASPNGRREKLIAYMRRLERWLLVATLAWPLLVFIELLWFDDLDPWELVLRDGKVCA